MDTETKIDPPVVDPIVKRRRPFALAAGLTGCVVVLAVVAVLVRNRDNDGASGRTEEPTAPALFVSVEPTTAQAGEPVTITVRQQGGEGVVHLSTPDFGDGTINHDSFPLPGYPCGYSTPTESRVRSFTHGYAVPGTYALTAEASIYDPCDQSGRTLTAQATIEITVADQVPSNGPAVPGAAVAAMPAQGENPRTFRPIVSGHDEDGHLRSFTLDWGDGTPAEVVELPLDGCTIGSNGWPGGGDIAPVHSASPHTYTEAGTYTLTVTVTTTGCDGSSPQQATFPSPPVTVP